MSFKKISKFFTKPSDQSNPGEVDMVSQMTCRDNPDKLSQLLSDADKRKGQSATTTINEKQRAEALENRKALIQVTGTDDASIQPRRAQVICAFIELERKLDGLHLEEDQQFIEKSLIRIEELAEMKIFT